MSHMFAVLDRQKVIGFPKDGSLKDREDYVRFQVETIARIYSLSNRLPTIGGAVDTLRISPTGLDCSGIRQ